MPRNAGVAGKEQQAGVPDGRVRRGIDGDREPAGRDRRSIDLQDAELLQRRGSLRPLAGDVRQRLDGDVVDAFDEVRALRERGDDDARGRVDRRGHVPDEIQPHGLHALVRGETSMLEEFDRVQAVLGHATQDEGLAGSIRGRRERRQQRAPDALPPMLRQYDHAAPEAFVLRRVDVHPAHAAGPDGLAIEPGEEAPPARVLLVGPAHLADRGREVRRDRADDSGEVGEVLVGRCRSDLEHQPPVIGEGSATTATGAPAIPPRANASAIRRPVVTAPSLADETSAAYFAMTPPR